MRETEPCNCEQSQSLIANQKALIEKINVQSVQIATLRKTVRGCMGLEKLVDRTIKDCNEVQYKDKGHKCESRKVVEKILQRFSDYQKERGGE